MASGEGKSSTLFKPGNEHTFKPGNEHAFPKGKSGNPGGQTKEQAQRARESREKILSVLPEMLDRTIGILRDPETKPELVIRGVEMLMKKVLPDLTSAELTGQNGAPFVPAIQVTFVKPDDGKH